MLTGEAVVFDWMKRRIQPLQAREMLGFQYQGTADSSRYSKEEISDDVAFSRVQRLLRNINRTPVFGVGVWSFGEEEHLVPGPSEGRRKQNPESRVAIAAWKCGRPDATWTPSGC